MNDDPVPVCFVDTNVLVYALSEDDPVRAPVAQELLSSLMRTDALAVSMQVLEETFVTLTGEGTQRLGADEALFALDRIAKFQVVSVDYGAIGDAARLWESAQISFWDALIVVAAKRARAVRIYTEDLQHGQRILGIEIVNPFVAASR